MAAAVLAAVLWATSAASADVPEEYSDYGDKWSMTCRFVYTGEGAETVLWDFGDGESAEGFTVDHTYAAVGEYYVKQTATNSVGSAVAYYRINICGYPTVTIDLGYGEPSTSTQSAFNVPAVLTDPSREGYVFDGWYTDPDFLNPYGGEGVVRPITIYAKWIDPSTPRHTVTVADPSGETIASISVSHGGRLSYTDVADMLVRGGKIFGGLYTDPDLKTEYDFTRAIESDLTLYAKYTDPQDSPVLVAGALLLAAMIALAVGVLLRQPIAVIAGAALVAVGACVWFGVLRW